MSYMDRIRATRAFDAGRHLRFMVEGRHCGFIRPDFAKTLTRWPAVFSVGAKTVELASSLHTPGARSEAVAPIIHALRDEGLIVGWRDEIYPVATDFGEPPLLAIERAAARAFGIRTRGAHLNGVAGTGTDCKMWIARRAPDKAIDPGMLDNLVGGGVMMGLSPLATIQKECGEEAGIPDAVAENVQAKSTVMLLREVPEGVHWETLYTFDLQLDEDFVPVNRDGEVADFRLLPIREVRKMLKGTSEFTADAGLVALEFLLRHDLSATATAEHEELVKAIHAPLAF